MMKAGRAHRIYLAWLLGCLASGWAHLAVAGPVPAFSAAARGTNANLFLTATWTVADVDAGKSGNFYLAANAGGKWYANNGSGWVLWSGGALPAVATGPLTSRSIQVVADADLSVLVGTELYAGYGLSESDMMANAKFAVVYTVLGGASGAPVGIDSAPLASGKILFAATGSANPDDPYALYVMNADGSGRTKISKQQGHYFAPDIELLTGGGWMLAYSRLNQLRTFNTRTAVETVFASPVLGDRPDVEAGGGRVVFQGGETGASGLNIYLADTNATGMQQLTHVAPGQADNGEWPYFVPGANRVFYFLASSQPPRRIVNADGSGDAAIPVPGGLSVSHGSFRSDGSEFLHAQRMTSYNLGTGAVGTLNDLTATTTLLQQLGSLGLAAVPGSQVPGQGRMGTFALSADWSRDGARLVFDALVADASSGSLRGIAIFTWDIAARRLDMIYGPEPLTAARTNNYNYSLATPKWIP